MCEGHHIALQDVTQLFGKAHSCGWWNEHGSDSWGIVIGSARIPKVLPMSCTKRDAEVKQRRVFEHACSFLNIRCLSAMSGCLCPPGFSCRRAEPDFGGISWLLTPELRNKLQKRGPAMVWLNFWTAWARSKKHLDDVTQVTRPRMTYEGTQRPDKPTRRGSWVDSTWTVPKHMEGNPARHSPHMPWTKSHSSGRGTPESLLPLRLDQPTKQSAYQPLEGPTHRHPHDNRTKETILCMIWFGSGGITCLWFSSLEKIGFLHVWSCLHMIDIIIIHINT